MKNSLVKSTPALWAVAIVGVSLLWAGPVQANPDIYERTLHGTVLIVARQDQGTSFGTGALVDAQRKLVVTNYHVVGQQQHPLVFFPARRDGEIVSNPQYYRTRSAQLGIRGHVVVADRQRDLAVIQLEKLPADARALPLAAHKVRPGETVYSIGNSGVMDGGLWCYLEGKVRLVYQRAFRVGDKGGRHPMQVQACIIETSMPSNPGDSGGPIVNDKGELVGVNESIHSSAQLLSTGIHVNEIRAVLAQVGRQAPPPQDRRSKWDGNMVQE